MIIYITILLFLLTSIYLCQIIRFYYGLFKLKSGINSHFYSISIIIPARNEEHNISTCLASLVAQNYPNDKLEIIVVNDHSTDSTASIVQKFIKSHQNIKIINSVENQSTLSNKKRAITSGIKASTSELIFTTDADCVTHPDWLPTMVKYFASDVGLVTGLVVFDKSEEHTLFHKVQSLEFLSLVIAGAGSIGFDVPIIGNGANLAYRRSVFEEVDGFKGIDTLKSGDDDLFIQKVAQLTNWKIRCAIDRSSIISTKPVATVKKFLNQRIRWASKGIHYHNPLFVLYLISVYFFYLILLVTVPISLFQFQSFPHPVMLFILKICFDFLLLNKGTQIVGRKDLLKYFLFAELFQIPYILIVGFAGLWGKYSWKER